MRHIIDEIVLDFAQTFLAEDDVDGKYKGNEQYNGENDARQKELDRFKDVTLHLREVDTQDTGVLRWIVGHQDLAEHIFFTFGLVIAATIDLFATAFLDREMVRNVYTVVRQFCFQVKIEHLEVQVVFDGALTGILKDGVDHFVQQDTLMEVARLEVFAHGR